MDTQVQKLPPNDSTYTPAYTPIWRLNFQFHFASLKVMMSHENAGNNYRTRFNYPNGQKKKINTVVWC